MRLLAAASRSRQLVASATLVALMALGLGLCLCAPPAAREAGGGCHEPARAASQEALARAWDTSCCCAQGLDVLPARLEARTGEAQRGSSLAPPVDAVLPHGLEPVVGHSSATSLWLTTASPPLPSPPAFVLPLRV